jgi:CubicO group peptidase (beta-lactamase class C family)
MLGNLNFKTDSPSFNLDSVFSAMSLTKLVSAISVMQLVEKGMISLDADVGEVVPELAHKEIIHGFQEDGKPILTKATKPLTLR